ncbi:MAG: hypothetical protein C0424_06390 [Sphingobacteriaceae bacterium]|nr:hypothetical protein [Sphingobacteriaceae bacterium]
MKHFTKYWWVLATRALLLLIVGVISVTAPNMPLETLVFYLGFLSLAMLALSVFLLFTLFKSKRGWWPFVFIALFDAVLTYYCLIQTGLAAQVFLTAISIWAVMMGAGLMTMAWAQKGLGRVLLVMNGVLSLVFAGFVFFNPLKTTSANFMIGFYTILFSLFLIYVSFRFFMSNRQTTASDQPQANK